MLLKIRLVPLSVSILRLQQSLHSESGLAPNLTCPLSKKTECFNKVSPRSKFSLRGAASLRAESHLGDSLFCPEGQRKKSQRGTDCFPNADLEIDRAARRKMREQIRAPAATRKLTTVWLQSLVRAQFLSHKRSGSRHKSKWRSGLFVPYRSTVMASASRSLARGNVTISPPQGFKTCWWWMREASG